MDKLYEKVTEFYQTNPELSLEKYYDDNLKDPLFQKMTTSLELPKKELMKYTTNLEKSVCELKNCQKCHNLLECQNEIQGYIYTPMNYNGQVSFSYEACDYQKEKEQNTEYQKRISLFDVPKEILNASMKNIYTNDKERIPVVKWIANFLDNYEKNKKCKGLYLTGSFGCGKTYLVSAMLNELAKKGASVVIIYFPEFLRSLKSSFKEEEEYRKKFDLIKKSELLLIDDIGAESLSAWGRDEVLGTILQYRMQEELPTFFTSNLNLEELEEHLSLSTSGVDKVKSRRIMERIKQLTDVITLISDNKRK